MKLESAIAILRGCNLSADDCNACPLFRKDSLTPGPASYLSTFRMF